MVVFFVRTISFSKQCFIGRQAVAVANFIIPFSSTSTDICSCKYGIIKKVLDFEQSHVLIFA
jgi:hypothetical protein